MYRVMKKFDKRGPETLVGNFVDETKAKNEIQKRLAEDAKMLIKNSIYCLYEGYDLLNEYDHSHLPEEKTSSSSSASGQQGTGQRFSPTPLPTSPRPPGMPASSWTRPDEKDDKDKK